MAIAVAVMLRDEVGDILPWIAWYLGLGADAVLVFDDGSADGTAITAAFASLAFDVRVFSIVQDSRLFTERQKETYQSVLRNYASEFEWIGFFDADEYLDLSSGNNLNDFLSCATDIGAVAINWCNYGSSNHVLKPSGYPFDVYDHHFPTSEAINRHVKSFVRPNSWTGNWINVHSFDVGTQRTISPSGDDVVWSSIRGIIKDTPTWEGARLMHYQCRSMEHFVERMRKRPDLHKTTALWTHYDINTVPAKPARLQRTRAASALQAIVMAAVVKELSTLSQHVAPSPPRPFSPLSWLRRLPAAVMPPPSISLASMHLSRLVSDDGFAFGLHHDTGEVVADLTPGKGGYECVFLTLKDHPGTGFLLTSGLSSPVFMEGEIRVTPTLRFEITSYGERITLRNPTSGRYLSAPPKIHGGVVACNRFAASAWETFRLEALDESDTDSVVRTLRLDMFALASTDPTILLRDEFRGNILALMPILLVLSPASIAKYLAVQLGPIMHYLAR